MIKIVFCLRRLPSLTTEAFRQYWLETHGPLVRRHSTVLRMKRYVQSHTFYESSISGTITARNEQYNAYDGVTEAWFDSIDDIVQAGATKAGRDAGRILLADEKTFVDLNNSPIFFTREHEIFAY